MTAPAITNAPKTGRGLTYFGIGGTVAWLLLGIFYLAPRLDKLAELGLNEMGDFLAGSFAPLAFFWLVLGFFQQGAELRTSNNALWLQGEELRNSVEQQRDLVAATREGIAAETERLNEAREAARMRAQPVLELVLGGWGSGGDDREQSLSLLNHGETCTGVSVLFMGVDVVMAQRDRFDRGGRLDFRVTIPSDLNFPPIRFRVDYIDNLATRGSADFTLTAHEGALTVVKIEA